MTTPIELKVAGRLQGTTLSQLGNASIAPSDLHGMQDRWCLHPDEPDRELAFAEPIDVHKALGAAFTDDECECIRSMHQRYYGAMQRRYGEATGRGSWPAGCHPNEYPFTNYHCALVWIDFDSFIRNNSVRREVTDEEWQRVVVDARVWPTLENPVQSVEDCKRVFVYGGEAVRAYDRSEWQQRSERKNGDTFTMFDMSTWLCMETCRRTGVLYHEVFTGENGTHNVHEKMIPMSPNLGGYAFFNDGTCSDHVTSNIQRNREYSLGRFTGLRSHEGFPGHTGGLGHDFKAPQSAHRSIMSYAQDNTPYQGYRLAGDPYEYVEDHSWPELRRYFGGEPAKPYVSPVEPPPTSGTIIPGTMIGQIAPGNRIRFDGFVGPIPQGAVGRRYVVERMGVNSNSFRLIPESV